MRAHFARIAPGSHRPRGFAPSPRCVSSTIERVAVQYAREGRAIAPYGVQTFACPLRGCAEWDTQTVFPRSTGYSPSRQGPGPSAHCWSSRSNEGAARVGVSLPRTRSRNTVIIWVSLTLPGRDCRGRSWGYPEPLPISIGWGHSRQNPTAQPGEREPPRRHEPVATRARVLLAPILQIELRFARPSRSPRLPRNAAGESLRRYGCFCGRRVRASGGVRPGGSDPICFARRRG